MAAASLLQLPLPTTNFDNDILLTLISNYLLYSLVAFSYTTFTTLATSPSEASQTPSLLAAFADTLSNCTLLQWISYLWSLPSKHMNSVLTRAYTAITKSSTLATCPHSDAKSMYVIRFYALQLLLHTSPSVLNPTTFWDQTVKFTVAFVKDVVSGSASAEIKADATQSILAEFGRIMEVALATRADADSMKAWFSGSGFVGFCEYWMDFARRVRRCLQLPAAKEAKCSACRPATLLLCDRYRRI